MLFGWYIAHMAIVHLSTLPIMICAECVFRHGKKKIDMGMKVTISIYELAHGFGSVDPPHCATMF